MNSLRPFLDELYERYHRPEFLSSDPLEFVHRYPDPWDQEVVALLAALLAYGNVKQIRRSVQDALNRVGSTGNSPGAFAQSLSSAAGRRKAQKAFETFVHRFNRGQDIVLLLELACRSTAQFGSVGAHFLKYLDPQAEDISIALSRFIEDWRKWAGKRGRASFQYLLNSPEDGSCCKRWCMFLRWMGRKDRPESFLDPGLWTSTSPLVSTFPSGRALKAQQLVIPLDTHTGRISQYLALTRRKSLGWAAAIEVTKNLRASDPADPTRYDFALARLGILDLCQRKYRKEVCENCQLRPACRFAKRRASR